MTAYLDRLCGKENLGTEESRALFETLVRGEMEPVEMLGTATIASFAPRRTMDPFPNCFSIWLRVSPRARARSFSSMVVETQLYNCGR